MADVAETSYLKTKLMTVFVVSTINYVSERFRVVHVRFFFCPFLFLLCRYADLVSSIKKKFAKKRGHSLLEDEDVCSEEKSKRAFQKPKD